MSASVIIPDTATLRQQQRGSSTDSKKRKPSRAWSGWQPPVSSNIAPGACPVQKCLEGSGTFASHRDCGSCQDDPEDFAGIPDPGPNWVPDATMLHTMLLEGTDNMGNPWPPELPRDYCAPMKSVVNGQLVDSDKNLLDGVPIRGIPPSLDGSGDGPKIFCGVYTMEEQHAGKVRAMRETWAPHCDGFVAFSTRTDPRIPALAIKHEGPESYNNMWQKVRAIWRFIGAHYLNNFDYFILGQDDTLIIPENLRVYLKGLNQSPDTDLFAGRRFHYPGDVYFNDAGAGYVLSRGTLRKLYQTGLDHVDCSIHVQTLRADINIAKCLRKGLGISLTDTRDSQGRERFHPFQPGQHLTWAHPKPGKYDWYEDYNKDWGLKTGLECCAPDSVSFHYITKPAAVRHLWSLLYQCQE